MVDEVFDLLVELGASDRQLEFPVIYASAKEGAAVRALDEPRRDLRPLLEAILEYAPAPEVDLEGPLQFQAVTLGYDDYVGRLVIGRVARGRLRARRDGRADSGLGAARALPRHQALRLARPAAGRARVRGRGRAGGDRRRRLHRDRRHRLRPASARGPAAHPRGSADDPRALLREHLALRRPRGPLRHQPPDRRSAAARGARQRLDPDRGRRTRPTPSRSPAAASSRSRS